jgi:hypothetical protein
MPHIIIGVMGPGTGATAADQQTAYHLGQHIAQQGWILLTGGRNVGVMDAASRGAKASGGLTIGILPTATTEQMSPAVDLPILTDMGQARNAINVLSSRVVIACGLGAGTLSEIALALKTNRPVVLLHVDNAIADPLQQLDPALIHRAHHVAHAIDLVQQCLAEATFS